MSSIAEVNKWIADVWREPCADLDNRIRALALILEVPYDKSETLSKWMLCRIKLDENSNYIKPICLVSSEPSGREKCQEVTTVRP